MNPSIVAFTSSLAVTSFAISSKTTPRSSPQRPPAKPVLQRVLVRAVLDTPARNTHLQQHAEVVLRDYLTRSAVNTVMYYMHELGDGPSHQWLSRFEDFSEQVKAHKFKDGEKFLDRMKCSHPETCILRVGHPSGRFSRKLQFTIEPARIAHRIFDVRVQLSQEWARDLNLIEMENLEIQRLSFEKLLVKSERELDSKKNLIFDTNPFANDETPLRWKNYVGLKTLITQHAVTRLLPYMRDHGSNHEYMYLHQFVRNYGAIVDGDDFVRDLISKPSEPRTNPTFTVVPRAIALQVLELRKVVADEWISVMEFVPVERDLIVRSSLNKSLESSADLSEDARRSARDSPSDSPDGNDASDDH